MQKQKSSSSAEAASANVNRGTLRQGFKVIFIVDKRQKYLKRVKVSCFFLIKVSRVSSFKK